MSLPFLFAKAGVYNAGNPTTVLPEGIPGLVYAFLLGAFFGLLGSLLILPLIRYCAFLAGRAISGGGWVVTCVAVGAVGAVIWRLLGQG